MRAARFMGNHLVDYCRYSIRRESSLEVSGPSFQTIVCVPGVVNR